MADQSTADIPDVIPVSSTNVEMATYDKQLQDLSITFKSGRSYTYHDVPPDVVREFMKTSSPGQFVHFVLSGYAYD